MSQVSNFGGGGSGPTNPPVDTLTGNSGGAVGPDGSNNINVIGSGNVTVTGNPGTNTLTITSSDIASISITGDTGGPLVGSAFTFTAGTTGLSFGGAGSTETLSGTVNVGHGGTGATTFTSHGVLLGNTTSAITATAAGTTGQVLTGVTGSAPVWASPAGGSISITGDSGGALTGNAFTFTGGSTGLTFSGAGSTETLGGTLAIANGGTNATSMTNTDGVVYYDGTSLVTTTVGTAGQVLTSNGAGVAPTFQPGGGGGGGFTSIMTQVFTTSGTYTPTAGMAYCIVECVGGGASGYVSPRTGPGGAGGGGGGYCSKSYSAATIGGSQVFTIGAGGVGAGAVNNGGNTTFLGMTAFGGSTSQAYTDGGIGGGATGGDVNAFGNSGGPGSQGNDLDIIGGTGGGSVYGGGGIGSTANGFNLPVDGNPYGGGGGGDVSPSGAFLNGSGAAGVIIITEYIS